MLRLFCIAALSLAAVNLGLAAPSAPGPTDVLRTAQAPPPTKQPAPPATTLAAPPATTSAAPPATTSAAPPATTSAAPPGTTSAAPPATISAVPPATTSGATPPREEKMVTLQYPNSDVADVLHLYSQLTGKELVMDNFVQGKVNIFINRPIPREEAVKIIEMNLLMNGYSLVPAEGGEIVKVIGTGKNPRTAGVPIISDDADIPSGDHVISFLFKLRYADPIEMQQVLGQYLSPPQTFTSFLALPKASSILVTENSSTIRSLVHIIDQVDIPPAEVVSEFIKLERADATKVVEMLKEVFDKGAQPTAPGVLGAQPPQGVNVKGVRPVIPGVVPPQTKEEADLGMITALSEDSIVVGKIKIAADVRTNRIHVITRPVNMRFVRKLIAEFDANVEFGKPITRPLRYISAADILPVLVQALTEPGANGQGADPGAAAPGANPQQPRPRPVSNASSGFDNSSNSSGGGQNFSEELGTTAVDTAPKAVTIGNAKIIADQRANTIIVLGNREVVVKVMKILDEMDVKAPQVALSTVIGELRLEKNEEFGVDYFGRAKESVSGVVTSRNTNAGLPPSELDNNGNPTHNGLNGGILDPANLLNFRRIANAATSGTNVYLAAANSLVAVVKMLHSTGNFKVISRPTVFTTNNKKAIIASGQEIPVPVSTIGTINQVGTQQSNIQFKKIALQLEVVPLINSEKEVTLEILQKLDSISGTTAIDGNDIPTIATKYIKTTVSAPNCSTIVLGGLIEDEARRSVNGIPLLSKIPIVGALFRNTAKSKVRRELIVLMRPEVALTKLDLYRLRQKSSDKTHFGPEIDQDDCPDCPKPGDGKDFDLPAPDLPGMK